MALGEFGCMGPEQAVPRMDWRRLLCPDRLGRQSYIAQTNRSIFVQDHDRIVFSAPFRRLANKTQVQPLYENDHVHHRLIHSIEVSSVGRSLARRIGHALVQDGALEAELAHDLADVVQAACVAHDIGNPPFGHSGETSIGDWFAEGFAAKGGLFDDLPADLQPQFTAFEGNAQGFRILTQLEMYRQQGGMQLSMATLGAFSKYPVTAADLAILRPLGAASNVGLKKFGLFHSDLPRFREAADALGLIEVQQGAARHWRRHPLVFVMEAADDITYNIVDLEDAFTTGELPFEVVRDSLAGIAEDRRELAGETQSETISRLRAMAIGKAVEACSATFVQHCDAILEGRFATDLLSASILAAPFAQIRKMSEERIFTAPRKTALEISGRRIIANVMTGLLPVYQALAAAKWQPDALSGHHQQLVRALGLDLRGLKDAETALHDLADFTSGMTDRYAVQISRMLSGI